MGIVGRKEGVQLLLCSALSCNLEIGQERGVKLKFTTPTSCRNAAETKGIWFIIQQNTIDIKSNEQDEARKYLIDTIESLFPADSAEYPDTAEIGQRFLSAAIRDWTAKQLPDDWREMPAEILEQYAQSCAMMEFRDYDGCDADHAKWWNGYKEAKGA